MEDQGRGQRAEDITLLHTFHGQAICVTRSGRRPRMPAASRAFATAVAFSGPLSVAKTGSAKGATLRNVDRGAGSGWA